ncbi:Puromycin N-acetyltransferase [Gracilariopsis chorda]|uniref:Puromycin N-acetyltransferase n=1 Tax=Gracilariopsis chorda TaxID=448386 RepID=A0A2V3IK53_9FLOR|nr:Puromycin N-acetyltransferase [Gracilariopsis chorda]|eukprot:PXF42476.1 Puromycin N-acetyltransferase [Gracilariopsis chorda]
MNAEQPSAEDPDNPTRAPLLARLRHAFTRHRPADARPQPDTSSPAQLASTEASPTESPPAEAPPAEAPPAEAPPAEAPPAEAPPADVPPADAPPAEAPPAEAPPAEPAQSPQKPAARPVLLHDDANDVEHLAQTITAAFADDPFIQYLHRPNERHAHEKGLIVNRTVLHCELSRPKGHTTVHVTDDNNCVAIWHHPGHWKITGWYLVKFSLAMVRAFGWRVLFMASAMKEVERAQPEQPHMHLFIIGTHPDHQGKGYGTTVISEMLKHCDRERLPAYLESSNQRNLPFYRKHGFELIQQIQPARPACPPIYTMWREPRPIEKQ